MIQRAKNSRCIKKENGQIISPKGIKIVIQAIQEFYLETYETHLIQKIESSGSSYREKQFMEELLADYYKFIASFHITPIVSNKRDRDILYDMHSHEWCVCKSKNMSLYNKYRKIKDEIPLKECDAVRKHVLDILKNNTHHNIERLNKQVTTLFDIDETFKKSILTFESYNGFETFIHYLCRVSQTHTHNTMIKFVQQTIEAFIYMHDDLGFGYASPSRMIFRCVRMHGSFQN